MPERVGSTEGLGGASVTEGSKEAEHKPALKAKVAPAPPQPCRYAPAFRGRRNHKLTLNSRVADAAKFDFAQTNFIPPQATRKGHPSFGEQLAEASR